jgi:hypothetical protein
LFDILNRGKVQKFFTEQSKKIIQQLNLKKRLFFQSSQARFPGQMVIWVGYISGKIMIVSWLVCKLFLSFYFEMGGVSK